MSNQNYSLQMKEFRENYLNTLKKLISIEEEIEKAVFYFQKLEDYEQKSAFEAYQKYIENLQKLRNDLTQLMKENLTTIQTFFTNIQKEQNSSTVQMLSKMYSEFTSFVFDIYNPFYWCSFPSKK